MADRRMFAKTIVTSDAFLDMPASAQCLYFMLGIYADDDGFVNSPKAIMRQSSATEEDLRLLIAKRFIISLATDLIVIKHWHINNMIQKDRYKETTYLTEKAMLKLDKNKVYTEANCLGNDSDTICIQTVSNPLTQDSIGKDRLISTGETAIDTPPQAPKEEAVENPVENLGIYIDRIAGLYRDICISLHPLKSITSDTKKALADSRKTYSVEDYEKCFTLAEESAFLTGSGDRGWKASFHWLVQPANMEKVLEGRYKDKPRQATTSTSSDDESSFDVDEFLTAALTRTYGSIPKGMKEEIA